MYHCLEIPHQYDPDIGLTLDWTEVIVYKYGSYPYHNSRQLGNIAG